MLTSKPIPDVGDLLCIQVQRKNYDTSWIRVQNRQDETRDATRIKRIFKRQNDKWNPHAQPHLKWD